MTRRSPPTLVFRCPECGDQTKQHGQGAECGPCLVLDGRRSRLVACARALRVVTPAPGAVEEIETGTRSRIDGRFDRAQKSRM